MRAWASALALALGLALGLAAWPVRAQGPGPQQAVSEFIKGWADFPASYQPLEFGQVVKLDPSGPYPKAIRHRYRIMNAEAGHLITVDEIFYLDAEGQVMGSTNTSRWRNKRWGAGKEKW
jgi:hypothetical protein